MDKTTMITVEVVYGLVDKQKIIAMQVPEGITAVQAVLQSDMVLVFPEIDLDALVLGIFGKKCKADAVLFDHDRVEIYRPLIADPKEVRKKRAAEGKKMGKGGGALPK